MASLLNLVFKIHCSGMSGRCVSKTALHYTKIGDAGGVPLQRCEPSEFGSAHYTKIGDAGVRRRGLWTSLGSGQR